MVIAQLLDVPPRGVDLFLRRHHRLVSLISGTPGRSHRNRELGRGEAECCEPSEMAMEQDLLV
ncbi:hypothetical protein [Nonomuraea glycinis]|uniref:hypothetical protein n=1 Tax=Nonomuraea glycinis TaxID=2047744 RepID=UPI0033A55FEF